ncbi:hypothetical protein UFOVP299_59 [uncultured Caudovirales phage]|uniref:Uncharacterized protein n=1 Tax=uncultured Caudovirales phage TaxID=2100421 RepID=A0A6J5LTM8_9CAUD|nr:hypothetical protein UFOVP299_59 [uncultured Caudovirales phage]
MIINAQYFQTKELYIPNSVAQPSIGSVLPSATAQLNEEIESIEQSLLLDILGYEQLQELMAQFDEDGNWVEDPIQKWVDLVDGVDDWKGLRYTIGTKKISLIAYYVFFYYLGTDFQTYSTTGMQIPRAENSLYNNPSVKQTTVWNKFIRMYIGDVRYGLPVLENNWNGDFLNFSGKVIGNEVSLYDYLMKNRDLYDTTYFTVKTHINYMGL